jgi:hypothetical protein
VDVRACFRIFAASPRQRGPFHRRPGEQVEVAASKQLIHSEGHNGWTNRMAALTLLAC